MELLGFGFLLYVKRCVDQGTIFAERLPNKTKKKTIGDYFELYAGPEH